MSRYEMRVTVELIDNMAPVVDGEILYGQSAIVQDDVLLSNVTRGELDAGFIGDIETTLDRLLKVTTDGV